MLKRIKILLKDNIFLIAISITVGIIYLSIIKIPSIGIEIANIDKGYHSLAYFMLAITWLLAFYKKQKKYVIVISCIIFGIIIEVLQYTLTTYRTGEYLDVFANSSGVFLALGVFNLFFRKKNI
jgi:glycopeptide antibiotics resistance protein